ncbi:MAG TPA: helix-hairpin-helix domain-containing protein [Candidatus Saccharimonadales bacterium]|nr:helix-hairpin-helix domain-containing protein [Candidatus Saccharimonadales bacterium]
MNKEEFDKLLAHYDALYDQGQPAICDEEYDTLTNQYYLLFKQKYRRLSHQKIELPIPGPSLDKKNTKEEIDQFNSQYPGCKIISDKIDGISLFCHYYDKNKIDIITHYGVNVTHLLPYLQIPKNINMNHDESLVVRGELAITLSTFSGYKNTYKSPRNIIAGQVNGKKKLNPELVKNFTYLAFQLVLIYPNHIQSQLTMEDQFHLLNKFGFTVVPNIKKVNEVIYDDLIDDLKNHPCDFLRDGKVIAQNEYEPITWSCPKNKIAFKLEGETKETIVTYVEWNISKRQFFKPRIHYESVFLDYANLSWTTGFNAKFIKDYNIGPGAKILMIRRGATTPYLKQVLQGTVASFPECDYEWNDTKTDIIGKMSDEVKMKRMMIFFEVIGVKYLGLKTIEKLYHSHFNTVNKLIEATEHDLIQVDGIKSTSAKRIIDQIESCLENINMNKVMVGSCLFSGFGEKKIDLILSSLPSLVDQLLYQSIDQSIDKSLIDDLKKIPGINDSAQSFYDHIDEFIDFLNDVPKIKSKLIPQSTPPLITPPLITPPLIPPDNDNLPLLGQVIVFSGDKKYTSKTKSLGAIVDKNVTKRTTLLVVNHIGDNTTKERTCRDKNIPISSLDDFIRKYRI